MDGTPRPRQRPRRCQAMRDPPRRLTSPRSNGQHRLIAPLPSLWFPFGGFDLVGLRAMSAADTLSYRPRSPVRRSDSSSGLQWRTGFEVKSMLTDSRCTSLVGSLTHSRRVFDPTRLGKPWLLPWNRPAFRQRPRSFDSHRTYIHRGRAFACGAHHHSLASLLGLGKTLVLVEQIGERRAATFSQGAS